MAQHRIGNVFSLHSTYALIAIASSGMIGGLVWSALALNSQNRGQQPSRDETRQATTLPPTPAVSSGQSLPIAAPASSRSTSTKLTVNGQDIQLSSNGETHLSLPNEIGQTTVSASTEHRATASGDVTNTDISIFSSSESNGKPD